MAKKKRSRRLTKTKSRVQRVRQYDTKTPQSLLNSPAFRRARKRRFHRPVTGHLIFSDPSEDRRYWKPAGALQSHRTLSGSEALITETTKRIYKRGLSWRVFVRPNRTLVCAKRAYRRAVLFSKGRVGQGKKINQFKDRVMRQDSKISCRRR